MAEGNRKGVIIYTNNGNLKHEDADGWAADVDGDLNIFEGDNTIATYRRTFWHSVGFEGVTKPA
jgi:hypothetical protein